MAQIASGNDVVTLINIFTEPEPSGREGLADVRIIQAIYESAETRRPVRLELAQDVYPDPSQEITKPPIKEPELVKAASPSGN